MITPVVIISTTVTSTINVMSINHGENAYEMCSLTSNLLLCLLAVGTPILDQLFKANRRLYSSDHHRIAV